MLTSDLCLAFNSNDKYDRCKRFYGRDWSPHTKWFECTANYVDFYPDLDPHLEPGCCTWLNYWWLKAQGQDTVLNGKTFEMCGKTYTPEQIKKRDMPNLATCCKNAGRACVNCDNSENPQGVAYTDVADFAENEHMFLKYFI